MADAVDEALGRVVREVGIRAERLWEVALALHADPEYAFEEHRAARLLSGELEREGFTVERDRAGLPTAFAARAGTVRRPAVALLPEYDAVPGLGHACGHNLIAAAGFGAALAARAVLGGGRMGPCGPWGRPRRRAVAARSPKPRQAFSTTSTPR